MNVIMLSWEYPPRLVGGLARHVYAVAHALARQGATVYVLTSAAPDLPPVSMEDEVHVLRVTPYFHQPDDFRLWVTHLNFALLEAGARLIGGLTGPVVLHAHDWLVAYAAKGLKQLFNLPLVATIHATEYGRQHGIQNPGQQYISDVEWWLTYEAARVIVCSEAMRLEVRNLFGLRDGHVTVIPNGIDLKPEAPGPGAPPRDAFAAPSERLLFHIGRLVPEKGARVLLNAMPMLLENHPVRLVIGGTGAYGAELRRQASLLGVASSVDFIGFVDDETADALFHYADVVVVPSTYEPFGIVALEAMAAGTPLVASRVGGLAEIVHHGENGLLAEPDDPDSLAEQIDTLLRDRTLGQRLTQAAKAEVQDRYAWSTIAQSTSDVYADVLAAHAKPGAAPVQPLQNVPPFSGAVPGRYTI
jgi:glycogen(starch) synthase